MPPKRKADAASGEEVQSTRPKRECKKPVTFAEEHSKLYNSTSKKRQIDADDDDKPKKKSRTEKAPPPAAKASAKKTKPAEKQTAKRVAKPVAKKAAPKPAAKPVAKKPAPEPKEEAAFKPYEPADKTPSVAFEPTLLPPKKIGKHVNAVPKEILHVFVCGNGEEGQLGLGNGRQADGKFAFKVNRPRLNQNLDSNTVGVIALATGGQHCAAITHDNRIFTWGNNDNGALGRDTTWDAPLKDAGEDSDSDSNSDSDDGEELSNATNPIEHMPTAVESKYFAEGTVFTSIACSDSTTFVVTEDGLVYGWGMFRSSDGELGFSSSDTTFIKQANRPTWIKDLKNIVSITCGANFAMALDKNGSVFSWGGNENSELGHVSVKRHNQAGKIADAEVDPNQAPAKKQLNELFNLAPTTFGIHKASAIFAGGSTGFAIKKNGEVHSWGANHAGQTGHSHEELTILNPRHVESLKKYKVKQLALGGAHTIALTEDGDVLGWGRISAEQVGIPAKDLPEDVVFKSQTGLPNNVDIPQHVKSVGKCRYVAAGNESSGAISVKGELYTWGENIRKQLGTGARAQRDDDVNPVPTAVKLNNAALREKEIVWADFGGGMMLCAVHADN